MFEIDHFDAHFRLVFAEQVLGVVGAVKIFAGRVCAGSRVVAANDEMGASVVFADEPVPNRLAGARHAHRKVQQRHGCGGLRVLIKHRLVAAHSREVINVTGLCKSYNRMNK